MNDTHKRPPDAGDDGQVGQDTLPPEPLPMRIDDLSAARYIGKMIGRWAVRQLEAEQAKQKD